ncbi:hypothetical protein GOODEAATRI_011256 [Goodea atripinnis]|uniref:EF-hand domain-containing protein n=1 Tax=Goodea atripinnis TaxID=208336 RepID=A0ABV0NJB2_9TELE
MFIDESITIDTTILVHFFGKKGKAELTFDDFYRSFFQFLNNLEDFAIAMQMYNFASRSIGQGSKKLVRAEAASAKCFCSIFLFCVNGKNHHISLPDEFARAVYVATGLKLTRHLVNTIFKIFDVDHDEQLSYKEFIGIMKDRLHRGGRVRSMQIHEKMYSLKEQVSLLKVF